MNKSLGVIFDFDGVLVNSSPYNRIGINTLFEPHGFTMADLVDEHGEEHRGQSLRDILKLVKSTYGVDFDVNTFSRQTAEIGFALMEQEGKLTPDPTLVTLLQELKIAGIPVGIGSSSVRWRIDVALGKLGISEYFPVIVTAEDVEEHKPNPHVFLEAALRLGVQPAQCIVIEDAVSGIEAAKRAGMKVVGFTSFLEQPDSLRGADVQVTRFSELSLPMLKNLFEYV